MAPNPKSLAGCLVALVLLGFALRLGMAIAQDLDAIPAFGTDQQEYDRYAWNLANGNGYRGPSADVGDPDHLTAYRPPFPSALWAGVYLFVSDADGTRHAAVRVLNCLLGAIAIAVVFDVGRLCFDRTIGLLAAAGFAVWPTAIYNSTQLLSEPLAILLSLGLISVCLRFAWRPSVSLAAVAGLLLGLSLLTRAGVILLVPLLGLWALWQLWEPVAERLRRIGVALVIPVVAGLVLAPWVVRNYLVFDAFIPFSTMGGSVLLQGNNRIVVEDERYHGYCIWDTAIPEYAAALQSANNELERDQRAKAFALEWIGDNVDKWPFLVRAKLQRGWSPVLDPDGPRLQWWVMLLTWGPVLALTIVAAPITLWSFLRRRHPGWLLHLNLLHFCILTVLFFGFPRYRLPIEPLCLVFASAAVAWVWNGLRVKRCEVQAHAEPTQIAPTTAVI